MFFSQLVPFDEELHEVLRLRRENVYTEILSLEVTTEVNETTEPSHSGKAQWTTESDS